MCHFRRISSAWANKSTQRSTMALGCKGPGIGAATLASTPRYVRSDDQRGRCHSTRALLNWELPYTSATPYIKLRASVLHQGRLLHDTNILNEDKPGEEPGEGESEVLASALKLNRNASACSGVLRRREMLPLPLYFRGAVRIAVRVSVLLLRVTALIKSETVCAPATAKLSGRFEQGFRRDGQRAPHHGAAWL